MTAFGRVFCHTERVSFPEGVPTVAASEIDPGRHLLDVREIDEWELGHAGNSTHIPLSELPGRIAEIDLEDDQVVVICRFGGRSERAVAYLINYGIDAVNVDGGLFAWVAAGRSLVRADGSAGAL